jgi:hypothetical protein
MYACPRETAGGFSAGVCRLEDRPLTFRDPLPPRCHSRMAPCQYRSGASRRSESLFVAPIYVASNKPQAKESPMLRPHSGEDMQTVDMDFYEKALFVKPTWRSLSVAEAQLLIPFALCFYPHFL